MKHDSIDLGSLILIQIIPKERTLNLIVDLDMAKDAMYLTNADMKACFH